MTEPFYAEICDPPYCVRPIGHDGECRSTWTRRTICGAPLRDGPCFRTKGHGWDHRSANLMGRANATARARWGCKEQQNEKRKPPCSERSRSRI